MEKTTNVMLTEFNTLVKDAIKLGLVYRERKCFKDRKDAIKCLEMIESSIRAAKKARKPEQESNVVEDQPFEAAPTEAEAAPVEAEAEAEAEALGNTAAETAPKTRKPRAKKANNGDGPRKGSKMEGIAKLLKRAKGCTAKEVLEATGWAAVSMPAMAKHVGLQLRKEKEKGSLTRYYGE